MGNLLVPCCSLTPRMCTAAKAAVRVILPGGGGIRQFSQPLKAAELMLEHPGYFLINSASMNMGRRFSALSADEDLEMGNVYGMFPLRRVNSVVTAADMEMAAELTGKRVPAGIVVRVSPENGVNGSSEAASSLDLVFGGFQELELKYRLTSSRSKRPLLETIVEESVPAF